MSFKPNYEIRFLINKFIITEDVIDIDITIHKPFILDTGFIIFRVYYDSPIILTDKNEDIYRLATDFYNNLHLLKVRVFNYFQDYSRFYSIYNIPGYIISKEEREEFLKELKKALINYNI